MGARLDRWDYAPRMEEEASFEASAVLPPRRARRARLALVVPAVALAAIVVAGISGAPSDSATAENPDSTALPLPSVNVGGATSGSRVPRTPAPAQVFGMDVQRLDEVPHRRLGRDDVVAITGWYVATAITDCPPLAALYRQGSLPHVRGDADEWAFCDRSGVLYASRPDFKERPRAPGVEPDPSRRPGPAAVGVTLVVGVIVPLELEIIGGDATEVVVVGRFVDSAGCSAGVRRCPRELVVDHVAWTPGL